MKNKDYLWAVLLKQGVKGPRGQGFKGQVRKNRRAEAELQGFKGSREKAKGEKVSECQNAFRSMKFSALSESFQQPIAAPAFDTGYLFSLPLF